jgi:hypothetical protein
VTFPREMPLTPDSLGSHKDPKCRFFWRMQEPLPGQKPELENILPVGFPQWEQKMDAWGRQMKASVTAVAEMLAAGLGLPSDYFVEASKHGAHLLAPTASDLKRFGKLDEVLAGFHCESALCLNRELMEAFS